MRSTAASAGFIFAVVVGCSRTPPEPTPAATTTATTSVTIAPATTMGTGTGTATGTAKPASSGARCVTPVASTAPPTPKAAVPPLCPADPEGDAKMPSGEVTFPDAPKPLKIDVELAKTPHDVEKGLMYRQKMSDEHGMLFKLDSRRDHTFWMHNTCIPLDMMFIDDDGTIVGISESAPPLDDGIRKVGCPSSFVLEVNAGWTRKRGVAPGQKVTIPFSAR